MTMERSATKAAAVDSDRATGPASRIGSFALGTAGSTILGFAVVPLLAWIFAPADIGRYALLQSFIGLSSLIGPAGFDHHFMRTFHESPNRRLLLNRCFASSLIVTTGIAALLTATSLPASGGGPLGRVFATDSTLVIQMVILCIAASVLIRYWLIIPRMQGRGLVYSLGQTSPRLVLVAMIVVGGALDRVSFEYLVAAVLTSQVVTLAGLWPFVRSCFAGTGVQLFARSTLPGILSYTVPIMLSTVVVWIMSFFDRTLLRLLSTYDELALYSIAASIAAAAGVLQSLFSTLWSPTIYALVAEDESRAKHMTRTGIDVVFVTIGTAFCLAGLASPLARLVVPSEYDGVSFLIPACLSLPLIYVLGECTVTGAYVVKRTRLLLVASGTAGIVSLLVNVLLIGARGATGAALAVAISSATYFVLRTEVSVRTWLSFPRWEMYAGVIGFVFVSCLHAIHGDDHAMWMNVAWVSVLGYVVSRAVRTPIIADVARRGLLATRRAP